MAAMAGLPPAARGLIVGTAAAGALALAAGLALHGAWYRDDVLGFVAIALAVAVGQRFLIPFRYGTETGNFDVTDAVFVAGLLLVDPGPFLLGVAVGVAAGQLLVARVAPYKIAFNVGQHLVGLGIAAVIASALGDDDPVSLRSWAAAVTGMAAYFVVNESSVDMIIAIVEREKFRRVLLPALPLAVGQWAGNVALGLLTVLVWTEARFGLPLLAAPVVLSYLTSRSWVAAKREQADLADMARAAEEISLDTDLAQRIPETGDTPSLASLAGTLNRMLDRLDASFRRERRFIREASHELRTPVTITRGYLEVLGPDPAPDELREAVDVALDELDRMGRLITDLTTLAKVDDPGFLMPGSVEVGDFVDAIAAKARPILNGRLRLGPLPSDLIVSVDAQRMTQAVLNLLTNARIHGGEGPVELSVLTERDWVRFQVADQGPGLPPSEVEDVFLPFHRANGKRPGSGLGLAIVRGIAEAHGGSAGVDNRPGMGATFWVRVPR